MKKIPPPPPKSQEMTEAEEFLCRLFLWLRKQGFTRPDAARAATFATDLRFGP